MFCYVNRILCILLCAALSAHAAGCASKDHTPVSMNDIFFDTVITITLYDYPGSSVDILDKCREKCDQFESLFSPTIEGSDIWNINHAESFPVQVSPDTAKMLTKAIDYGNMSGGLIDITIGSLTDIWDIILDQSVAEFVSFFYCIGSQALIRLLLIPWTVGKR